jgi:hypothetical protein
MVFHAHLLGQKTAVRLTKRPLLGEARVQILLHLVKKNAQVLAARVQILLQKTL